jgi:predicted phage replisome organizer
MASDVKWIKITTDIFDDEKILLIESLPDSYAIITVWFKLLCLAGKQNNSGVFMMGQIAYTDKMLATIFRMKETTVTMALQTFEQFGMIEIIDGVITIPNWGKHQNLEQIEARKEYQREYQREYRKKQRLIAEKDASDERKCLHEHLHEHNINSLEEEGEEEREVDRERDSMSGGITAKEVVDLYNSICKSYPTVKAVSDARKKAIKARLRVYSIEDFRKVFEMAEASTFLKGGNNRNWTANFDWLIKDANFAKVLDGNYNKEQPKKQNTGYGGQDMTDLDDLF